MVDASFHQFNTLGLNTTLVQIIRDTSYSILTLITGAPQGCGLRFPLFVLNATNCNFKHGLNYRAKSADDNTIINQIRNND